jgi:hypothetical protein
MRRLFSFAALVLVAGLAGGCVAPKSYVDPAYGTTKYQDIERRAEPYQWRIATEFQRNGARFPNLDSQLQEQVERIVRASGMAVPTGDAGAPLLRITVNNIADVAAARAKGFGTGLTFGLAGNTVTDYYEMTANLTNGTSTVLAKTYKHALHTTIGNAPGISGVEPVAAAFGFTRIVEEMLLNALKDVQTDGAFRMSTGTGGRRPLS